MKVTFILRFLIINNNSFITKNCYNCLESLIPIPLIKKHSKKKLINGSKVRLRSLKRCIHEC